MLSPKPVGRQQPRMRGRSAKRRPRSLRLRLSPKLAAPGTGQAASSSGLLLHPGLDLVEAGLGAGFVMRAAALSAVCTAEADRADDIVAGHDR
jgi:hypothetical protein